MHTLKALVFSLALVSFGAVGCGGSNKGGPVAQSSASQPGYAAKYPDTLTTSVSNVSTGVSDAKGITAKFQTHVDGLKGVDWNRVMQIVDRADEAGKSSMYAEAYAEDAAMREFWKDEGDGIIAKTSGNAQYQVKQASCTADVSGSISFGIKDSVTKALEKRLRAKNHAHNLIERYRTSLGKENAEKLEKLADDVAQASYIVHVGIVEQRDRLAQKVGEKDAVKSTLDAAIKDEQAFQAEAGRTDAEKKGSEERIAAYNKSKADLDGSVQKAQESLKTMDKDIEEARKDYDTQLASLKSKIKEKAAAEPAKK